MYMEYEIGTARTGKRNNNKAQRNQILTSGLVLFQSHWRAEPSSSGDTCKTLRLVIIPKTVSQSTQKAKKQVVYNGIRKEKILKKPHFSLISGFYSNILENLSAGHNTKACDM